jgi:hypothetical protein
MIGRNLSSVCFRLGIPYWFLVLEDPLQGPPLQPVLLTSPSLADLSRPHTPTNLNTFLHVLEHLYY